MRSIILVVLLGSLFACATVDKYGNPYPEPQRTNRQHTRAAGINSIFGFIIGVPVGAALGFSPFIAVAALAFYGAMTGDVIMEDEQ